MEFCPWCANLLQYEMVNPARLSCRSCPYICPIRRNVEIKRAAQLLKKEQTPDLVGENNAGSTVPTTEASCPKCGHGKAQFQQHQIRSADEPMTIFYKCLNESCGHQWRED